MLFTSLALAAPLAELRWSSGVGRLTLRPADGEHIQGQAGVTVTVGETTTLSLSTPESLYGPTTFGPVPLPAGDTTLTARFSVCDDANTRCTPMTLRAELEGARGRLPLTADVAAPTAASQNGVVGIYDFGAVWCPPCNLMLAEVLDDPADAALFATLPVTRIDVDRPESWSQKSRYGVTGYPTLIAVDAQGAEVARLIGYPGEAALKAWIGALGTEAPLHSLAAGMALPPADRARAARRLAEADQDAAARRYLDGAADGEDLQVARLLLDADPKAAAWLFDHKVPTGDWIWAAGTAAPDRWAELVARAPAMDPADAAGLYSMAAGNAPEALRPGLRQVALASVRAALDGDALHDKALWGDVADLEAETGDRPAAIRTLDAAIAAWPTEFTFYHAAARILLDGGDVAAAEKRAREALQHAFGDQVLRASVRLADVLAAKGDKPQARTVLDAALQKVPAPPEGVAVRTTRYRAEAEARKLLYKD